MRLFNFQKIFHKQTPGMADIVEQSRKCRLSQNHFRHVASGSTPQDPKQNAVCLVQHPLCWTHVTMTSRTKNYAFEMTMRIHVCGAMQRTHCQIQIGHRVNNSNLAFFCAFDKSQCRSAYLFALMSCFFLLASTVKMNGDCAKPQVEIAGNKK